MSPSLNHSADKISLSSSLLGDFVCLVKLYFDIDKKYSMSDVRLVIFKLCCCSVDFVTRTYVL